MDGWMDGWIDRQVDTYIYTYIHIGYIYIHTYIYIYKYICTKTLASLVSRNTPQTLLTLKTNQVPAELVEMKALSTSLFRIFGVLALLCSRNYSRSLKHICIHTSMYIYI